MGIDVEEEIQKIEIMLSKKNYELARKSLDSLIERYLDEYKFWRMRAYVFEVDKDYQKAIEYISEAINLQPMEPDYFYNRGRYFFNLSNYTSASENFTQAISLCDYHKSDYYREPSYFMRAESYLRLKLYDKARDDCSHLRDGYSAWTDSLRSKEDILNECAGN